MIDSELLELIEEMVKSELASPDEIIGCSDAEVQGIESTFELKLPSRYTQFLKKMGKCAGWLLEGSDAFYPEILTCRDTAEQLLAEEKSTFLLSKSRFVFLQHQGYQFLFFDTTCGEDPPVFRYLEGDKIPTKVADSFSEWLRSTIIAEIEINNKVKDKRPSLKT